MGPRGAGSHVHDDRIFIRDRREGIARQRALVALAGHLVPRVGVNRGLRRWIKLNRRRVQCRTHTPRAGLKFNLYVEPAPTLMRRLRKIAAIPRARKGDL